MWTNAAIARAIRIQGLAQRRSAFNFTPAPLRRQGSPEDQNSGLIKEVENLGNSAPEQPEGGPNPERRG